MLITMFQRLACIPTSHVIKKELSTWLFQHSTSSKDFKSVYEFVWNVPSTPWLPNQSINQSNWSAWHFQTKVDFQCTSNESNTSCCSSTAHCRSSQVKMKSCVLGFDDELAHRNQVVSCSTNLWWMKQESHISRKKKKRATLRLIHMSHGTLCENLINN